MQCAIQNTIFTFSFYADYWISTTVLSMDRKKFTGAPLFYFTSSLSLEPRMPSEMIMGDRDSQEYISGGIFYANSTTGFDEGILHSGT